MWDYSANAYLFDITRNTRCSGIVARGFEEWEGEGDMETRRQ
jgi:hypothetical protein